MPKRHYCMVCQFPLSVCLCKFVHKTCNSVELIVLQHPSETKVAKNTARLLALALQNIQIVVGETAQDFRQLQAFCLQHRNDVALLYPSTVSRPLEELNKAHNIKYLLLLDGTWKKAFKLYQCNPWLTALPCWHFAHPPASQYQRKAHRSDSLSTLEAAAYGLHLLENIDTAPLLVLQQKRQQFSGQRPD